jgi:3-hydroxyisobutyrate dehydrogenase-like beta-hydroxyacid dehydrogenase
VVDDAGVDEVLRGPKGALASMAAGGVVVVHSTVHPATCTNLQADFPMLTVVDAPVSGGGDKAAAGELLVMVGGPDDAVVRVRPVLETYGDPVLHVGPLGAGLEAKVLNNVVFSAQLALATEVFDLARTRGLHPSAIATILAAGSGRSYAAEVVTGMGFDVASLGPLAGDLLAKDVGIFVDQMEPRAWSSPLLIAADAALARMGVPRADNHEEPQ